jgi:hypothetical protein
MNKIYNLKVLESPTFFQKLLKKKPAQNFVLEVNNILAETQLMKVTQSDISEIATRYGGNVLKKCKSGITELYTDYLNHCLTDKALSDVELQELKHLKDILSLTDNDVNEIHNKTAGAIYSKSMNDIIADGIFDQSEEDFLTKLQNELKLSDDLVNKISEELRGKFVQDFYDKVLSDERLSPLEEQQLESIGKNLNIKVQVDDKTKSTLDRYKLYWIIENGEIPEINVTLSLEKNEKCYFHTDSEWYEMRTVTQRVNYSGTSASIKIMKGVRYRVGSIKPQITTSEQLKQIDYGTIYLTNKRIILIGQHKNSNIKLQKVLSFTPYSDGVEISKDTGRNSYIKFTNNVDLFTLILSRLLND